MSGDVRREIEAALTEAVGVDHVLTGEPARRFAVDGVSPRYVVFPASVDEVSRCLAATTARGLAVAPTGRGTRLGWGNVPRRLDVVLSLRRLDRILEYEPADLTVSVEAGVTMEMVNAHLRGHRQFLPLDPACAAGSTVGGLMATAASGPYRVRYGTMRDLVLGVTVVQADGTVVKGGGRVVKNVTGYDMPKLHVGALGTLGVIVQAHLRLHPIPAEEATWLFGFPSAEAVLDAALGIRDTPLVMSRLQLVDAGTLAMLGHAAPPAAALGLTIGSVPQAVRAQGERAVEVCRRCGGAPMGVRVDAEWWRRVSDAAWPPQPESTLTLRVGTRASDVVKALRAVEGIAAAAGAEVHATSELGNGVLHANLLGPARPGTPTLVAGIRANLAALGATCVVEHAPSAAKRSLDVWGDVEPALGLMRRLKAELDPQGVLNPGRFVGGI